MICVDSSVAAKWLLVESDTPLALRLIQLAARQNQSLVAPSLISYELTNILRKRCRRDGMTNNMARQLLSEFQVFDMELVQPDRFHMDALEIANSMDLVASYDAYYLALARQERCDFWTADKRLLNALRGRLPFVRDLASLTDDAIGPAS